MFLLKLVSGSKCIIRKCAAQCPSEGWFHHQLIFEILLQYHQIIHIIWYSYILRKCFPMRWHWVRWGIKSPRPPSQLFKANTAITFAFPQSHHWLHFRFLQSFPKPSLFHFLHTLISPRGHIWHLWAFSGRVTLDNFSVANDLLAGHTIKHDEYFQFKLCPT